jgi:hypothetical protein
MYLDRHAHRYMVFNELLSFTSVIISCGNKEVVGDIGLEPMTSSVSTKRSPPELTAQMREYYTILRVICKAILFGEFALYGGTAPESAFSGAASMEEPLATFICNVVRE